MACRRNLAIEVCGFFPGQDGSAQTHRFFAEVCEFFSSELIGGPWLPFSGLSPQSILKLLDEVNKWQSAEFHESIN